MRIGRVTWINEKINRYQALWLLVIILFASGSCSLQGFKTHCDWEGKTTHIDWERELNIPYVVVDAFSITTHFKPEREDNPMRTLHLSVPRRDQFLDG